MPVRNKGEYASVTRVITGSMPGSVCAKLGKLERLSWC